MLRFEEDERGYHSAVQCNCDGDARKQDIIVSTPPPGDENEEATSQISLSSHKTATKSTDLLDGHLARLYQVLLSNESLLS